MNEVSRNIDHVRESSMYMCVRKYLTINVRFKVWNNDFLWFTFSGFSQAMTKKMVLGSKKS